MVVFAQSGCIRAKVVVFGQSVCIRAKVVVFGQKWLYSGNSGCIRAKVVVLELNLFLSGTSGCIRAKWFYLGKVAVFGQTFGIRAKVAVFLPKCLYSVKFVLFG